MEYTPYKDLKSVKYFSEISNDSLKINKTPSLKLNQKKKIYLNKIKEDNSFGYKINQIFEPAKKNKTLVVMKILCKPKKKTKES